MGYPSPAERVVVVPLLPLHPPSMVGPAVPASSWRGLPLSLAALRVGADRRWRLSVEATCYLWRGTEIQEETHPVPGGVCLLWELQRVRSSGVSVGCAWLGVSVRTCDFFPDLWLKCSAGGTTLLVPEHESHCIRHDAHFWA